MSSAAYVGTRNKGKCGKGSMDPVHLYLSADILTNGPRFHKSKGMMNARRSGDRFFKLTKVGSFILC